MSDNETTRLVRDRIIMYKPEADDLREVRRLVRAYPADIHHVFDTEAVGRTLSAFDGHHIALETVGTATVLEAWDSPAYGEPVNYWVGPLNGYLPAEVWQNVDEVVRIIPSIDRPLSPSVSLALAMHHRCVQHGLVYG